MAALRFEYSIDCLTARKEELNKVYNALLNQPRNKDTQSELNRLNRQMMDIEDTINNLYAIREVCPSR